MDGFEKAWLRRERMEEILTKLKKSEAGQVHKETKMLYEKIKKLREEESDLERRGEDLREIIGRIERIIIEKKEEIEWLRSIDYVLIFYKDGMQNIYTRAAPEIKLGPDFLREFNKIVTFTGKAAPEEEGAFVEGRFRDKKTYYRSGRFELIIVIARMRESSL
jgi:hypothetical protein